MEGEKKYKEMPVPAARDDEYREVAWAIDGPEGKFKPVMINRPKVAGAFVKFDMKYCGICHSDCSLGGGLFPGAMYPMVPGHELCGVVSEVGPDVTTCKVGDKVGVGCIIDSCLDCEQCTDGFEMYCDNGGSTHTYNTMKGKYEALGKKSHFLGNAETQTFGGYSGSQVVHEHFIIPVPDAVPLEKAGPIMCAGATMWEPLCYYGMKDSEKQKCVGIVGLGGLGTMGVKLAKAMGHQVMVISSSPGKEALAKEKGADFFCICCDPESMKAHNNKCDLILDTVSADHQLAHTLPLLRTGGTICMLGLVLGAHNVVQLPLMFKRKSISGSLISGIKSTAELLKFCAEKGVYPDVKLVEAKDIDSCWEKLNGNTAGGDRFVIDIEKSKANKEFCATE